jgi:hypothetical protein
VSCAYSVDAPEHLQAADVADFGLLDDVESQLSQKPVIYIDELVIRLL